MRRRFGGTGEGRAKGQISVRRLQVSAGRFLPETLGNRRHLHRADVVIGQFNLEVSELCVTLWWNRRREFGTKG